MLHPEALLIVNVPLSVLNLHRHIHMSIDQLLRLSNVHSFDLRHIVGHFFDRHVLFFLIDQVLDILELLGRDRTEG
jgi:hypothetical protein